MGKRGAPMTPSAIRRLQGDKDAGKGEVVVPDAMFGKPINITPGAERTWDRLAPLLRSVGLLKETDLEAFAAYCEAVWMWQYSTEMIEREGYIIEQPVYNKAGYVSGTRQMPHPAYLTQKEANSVMLRYASRFGLTPSDRATLAIGDVSDSSQQDARRYLTA